MLGLPRALALGDYMRLKIVQNFEQYRVGQIIKVSAAKAKLLLKSGAAIITRDIEDTDLRKK